MLSTLVDDVLPILPPYEFSLYLLLVRHSRDENGESTVRLGKRSILSALGQGTRSGRSSYAHVSEKLAHLSVLGFIEAGETTKDGTLYRVRMPHEVSAVRELVSSRSTSRSREPNHYMDPSLRIAIFDRDQWECQYCGDLLTEASATLDHIVPRSRGGTDEKGNLATCCMMCNAIKSDRTYEEAAPQLLERVARSRRPRPIGGEVDESRGGGE